MSDGTPEPVGWFVKSGQLITILPEKDQSADDAIQEEAKDHGIEPSKVRKGKPPEDWKDAWGEEKKDNPKPETPKSDKPKETKDTGNPSPSPKPVEVAAPKPPPADEVKSAVISTPAPPTAQAGGTDWLGHAKEIANGVTNGEV